MFFSAEEREERYIFTYEERAAALKRSGGVCACCGKKMTTKTMTVDHIIPISRGGTNDAENLIALCPECNKEKGNMLYMPCGYYLAIENQNELHRMERYVEKWFKTVKDQFDIQKFPLIAPQSYMQLSLPSTISKKKKPFIPQMIFKWTLIGTETYEEIEAVTNIDIREIRREVPKLDKDAEKLPESVIPTVALYALRKLTTDKIIAVIAIQVIPERKRLIISMPWCTSDNKWQGTYMFNFVSLALTSIVRIAGYEIDDYILHCPNYLHGLDFFTKSKRMDNFIAQGFGKYAQETETVHVFRNRNHTSDVIKEQFRRSILTDEEL